MQLPVQLQNMPMMQGERVWRGLAPFVCTFAATRGKVILHSASFWLPPPQKGVTPASYGATATWCLFCAIEQLAYCFNTINKELWK